MERLSCCVCRLPSFIVPHLKMASWRNRILGKLTPRTCSGTTYIQGMFYIEYCLMCFTGYERVSVAPKNFLTVTNVTTEFY